MGGLVVTEAIFDIRGIGKVPGPICPAAGLCRGTGWTILYFGFVLIIVNLIVDVSYALIDPKDKIGSDVGVEWREIV